MLGVEVDLILEQLGLDLVGVAEGRLVMIAAGVAPIDLGAAALDRGVLDLAGIRGLNQVVGRFVGWGRDVVEALVTGPDDCQETSEQDEIKDVAVSASHGHAILTPGF